MTRRSSLLLFLMAVPLLVGLAGCVKLRQTVTVMPDGSGKIELRFGLGPELIALAAENEEDPFKEVLPEVMQDKTRGVVAMSEPVRSKEDGFSFLTYALYFRDINQLRIDGLGEGKPAQYRYTREGDSAQLTVTHGTILSMVAKYEETPEAERADVREALAGLAFGEHFRLPGEVKPIDGVATDANTAKLDLTIDHLLEGTGPIKKLKDVNKLTFVIPKVALDQQVIDAFNQELEAAEKAWQAKQADAE